jgi:hypothetical protein
VNPVSKQAFCEALRTFGSCEVTVGGRSMWPFIRPGDTVTVSGGHLKPRRGMVIAFFAGDQLIVHRIIRVATGPAGLRELLVHGDSSPGSRAVISQDRAIGDVIAVKRDGRPAAAWLRPPLSWFAVVAGFALQGAVILSGRRAA